MVPRMPNVSHWAPGSDSDGPPGLETGSSNDEKPEKLAANSSSSDSSDDNCEIFYKIAAQEAIALYKAGVKAAETAEKDMHTASAGSEGKEKQSKKKSKKENQEKKKSKQGKKGKK